MIFIDDILTYFRDLGHAAEYGTLAQLNEQLGRVDYSASTGGMVVFVRLIGEQRTVDGRDQCDIAVHLSWLCPLDFDGETLLSTQEQAKGTLKAWLQHLRDGNTVTVSEDARWQFGYDDFAENVAWIAVRVTLTSAAADCVPFAPEPPTPQTEDYVCPIVVWFNDKMGLPSPCALSDRVLVSFAIPQGGVIPYSLMVSEKWVHMRSNHTIVSGLSESAVNLIVSRCQQEGRPITAEAEAYLRDRIGYDIVTVEAFVLGVLPSVDLFLLMAQTATEPVIKPIEMA